MKRRNCLKGLLAAAGLIVTRRANGASMDVVEGQRPIELHLDLAVDPAREQEMLRVFENDFKPAASKQPGFIAIKMLKLATTLRGPAPVGCNYQFVLVFATEELRQKWVATPTHKMLWPKIEATLNSPNYSRLLYEIY
jgi:heme-degrading monooxygenase HmoA